MKKGLPKKGRSGPSIDNQQLRKAILIILPFVIIGASALVYFAWIQTTPKIGVININGTIRGFKYADLAEKARDDPSIEGVVLKVNSPGGGVVGTFQTESSVLELRRRKPVVASLQEYAASGAYVVASAAHHIYAYKYTTTAGLGVIARWVSYENYYEQKGIEYHIWKTGEHKDMFAPWRSPTEEENEYISNLVKQYENQLFNHVASNRPSSENYLDEVRDGLTRSGFEALGLNLIDHLGTYEDAVERTAEMADLDEGEYKTVNLSEYYG